MTNQSWQERLDNMYPEKSAPAWLRAFIFTEIQEAREEMAQALVITKKGEIMNKPNEMELTDEEREIFSEIIRRVAWMEGSPVGLGKEFVEEVTRIKSQAYESGREAEREYCAGCLAVAIAEQYNNPDLKKLEHLRDTWLASISPADECAHVGIDLEDDMGGAWRKCNKYGKLEVVKDNAFATVTKSIDSDKVRNIADGISPRQENE